MVPHSDNTAVSGFLGYGLLLHLNMVVYAIYKKNKFLQIKFMETTYVSKSIKIISNTVDGINMFLCDILKQDKSLLEFLRGNNLCDSISIKSYWKCDGMLAKQIRSGQPNEKFKDLF